MAGGRSNSRHSWRSRAAALALGCTLAALLGIAGIALLEWDAVRADARTFGEAATRWRDANTEFDPQLGWRPIADRSVELAWGEVRTNAEGFRSAPLHPDAEAVAVLGDSVAWGLGVPGRESFPGRLDAGFARRGWQVSNLAVSGYGLGQSHLWLQRQRASLPRLRHVILAVCADNDLDDTRSNSRYGRRKPLFRSDPDGLRLTGVPIARHGLRHWYTDSHLLRGVLARWPWLEAWYLGRAGDLRLADDEAERVLLGLLNAIRDEVADRGGRLHVALLPSTRDWDQLSPGYELLGRVGLSDKAEMTTRELSHGEHRHMEIAIALAANADLMLLDEPMAGLGTEESAAMVRPAAAAEGSAHHPA